MSHFSKTDYHYMQRAITLAKRAHYTTSPNPRVGCVLVKDQQVIGEGFHIKAGSGHAEVNALVQAGSQANGATAYVTLEPCSHYGRTPPCAEGLIKAGIKQVICAMEDPNPQVSGRGIHMLERAGITTQVGLLEKESKALNKGFITLMSTGLPYVRAKMAASLDGKTAMASGESKWITSADARRDVQRLRAQSCAIVTGADSVLFDNAKMNVRWSELGQLKQQYLEKDIRQPIRVIIDSQNRLTPDVAIFEHHSPIIIMRTSIEKNTQWPHFVRQVQCPISTFSENNKICLQAVLKHLAELGLNDVMIESGAQLVGAFVEQNLVDELILYQAPKLLGAEGKSLLNMPSISQLSSTKQLEVKDVRMVGSDIRITAQFIK